MGKTMVSFRLPEDLLAELDARAEGLGISRSQWYENMTRWVLANTYTQEQDIGARIRLVEQGTR